MKRSSLGDFPGAWLHCFLTVGWQKSFHVMSIGRRAGVGEVVRTLGEGARHDDRGLDPVSSKYSSPRTAHQGVQHLRPRQKSAAFSSGSNSLAIRGELMGRFVGTAGGGIVVVSGLQRFVGQGEREMGFRSVLAERYPQCRLVAVVETRSSRRRRRIWCGRSWKGIHLPSGSLFGRSGHCESAQEV